jgi:hypothetical protein
MRFSWFFALVLVGSVVTASAQQHHKPGTKPSSDQGASKAKASGTSVKSPVGRDAASQELRRLEQETAKSVGAKRSTPRQRVAPVKAEHEKQNPPIRFSGASGAQGGSTASGKNPYKGRLRQKGGGRH